MKVAEAQSERASPEDSHQAKEIRRSSWPLKADPRLRASMNTQRPRERLSMDECSTTKIRLGYWLARSLGEVTEAVLEDQVHCRRRYWESGLPLLVSSLAGVQGGSADVDDSP